MNKARNFIVLSICPLLASIVLAADGENEAFFPGSRMSLTQAVHESTEIVVATVIQAGTRGDTFGVSNIHYHNLNIKVTKILNGNPPENYQGVNFSKTLIPLEAFKELPADSKRNKWESLPKINEQYLFFLKGKHRTMAVKVLPATQENLRSTLQAVEDSIKKNQL